MPYQRVKGTRDILPPESAQWVYIENFIRDFLQHNNYKEIRTPAFEFTELFIRGIGTETDIVSKEMYTFVDKGGHSITLKPELTAPVIRAYLQNDLAQQGGVTKLYYLDALFRQERPQKGRLRQFHQFGFEIIGTPHPEADAEVIQTMVALYQALGIEQMQVRLNSIGSRASRADYLKALKVALEPVAADFCPTCQERLQKNILRLFDCKVESCQQILTTRAPRILDYLSEEDGMHFREVCRLLDLTGISYKIDHQLVRGLDYYTRTTFEITSPLLGSQDAICGGGRYDHLVEDLGGKPTPAVGVASGLERLLLVLEQLQKLPQLPHPELIFVVTLGAAAREMGFKIITQLRARGKTAEMDFLRRSLKAQLREADRTQARWVVIIGEHEIQQQQLVLKDMSTGNQQILPLSTAVPALLAIVNANDNP